MRIKLRLSFSALLLLITLCGCTSATAEDLYTLPQLSERYLQLQTVINQLLSSGAKYAPPASGSHRQSIQMEDLDGDGVGEVIAFLNFSGSDKPLKLLIFRQTEDGYEETARIEGEGTGIDCVNYTDMDGDGLKEVAVGWQIVPGINYLSVYSVRGEQVNELFSTDYTEFLVCQLDKSKASNIVALRLSSSDRTGTAILYSVTADGEVVTSTAPLSFGTESLLRVRSTQLTDGKAAVLLESRLSGGGFVTDILALRTGGLSNITLDKDSGVSQSTVRTTEIYCRDMDGDGVLEVPQPVAVPSASETLYYRVEWYSWSSSGRSRLALNTYSNYIDGWYLILPQEWVEHIAIRRSDSVSGERSVIFSKVEDDGTIGTDFLIIYALTGDSRAERASVDERFMLQTEEETIFCAVLCSDEETLGFPLSEDLVRSNFRIYYTEWLTGET